MLLAVTVSCGKGSSGGDMDTLTTTTTSLNASFAKGADISWLTQMEAAGNKFYNSSGTQQDLLQILKDKGINSIRLRVWVNQTLQAT